jgi:proline iminopeptidase
MAEPYATGLLDVGDGHRVYWECCGNPEGRPALYLHGGPGGGSHAGARNFFDASTHRAVLFDQRGCGRSRPLASDPDADLRTNTTQHLIADIESLRAHLGIERWAVILGMSWGTTLALAYAHAHPDRVEALVLALVGTTSRDEVWWYTEGVGRIFPREWDRFRAHVPARLAHLPLVDAYADLLADPATAHEAAIAWCAWEDAHVSLTPGHRPSPLFEDPAYRLAFARLVTHYWRHAAFLDDALLRDAGKLDGTRAILIHGVYDVSGPLDTAWKLAQRWKTAELRVMEDGGHGGPSFPDRVRQALADVARRVDIGP